MTSYHLLARSAYETYRQRQLDANTVAQAARAMHWDHLTAVAQADWIEVVKKIVAEMATVH